MASSNWPENVELVEGNLLECKEQYLCHQCNCITVKGAHLSGDVFERFPYANIYIDRLHSGKRDIPGTIIIRGRDPTNERLIINMLAQYYPGKSRFGTDTASLRQQWFQSCLLAISEIPDLQSLAFPYNIGCGAAGGDWSTYKQMICKFAKTIPTTKITIYRLPSATPKPTSLPITTPIPIPISQPKQTKLNHFISKK